MARASRWVGTAVARLLPVLLLGFVLFRLLPGDPALALTRGRPATADQLAATRHALGLDRPLVTQFVRYLGAVLRGDLGESFEYHRPVWRVLAGGLGPTLLLAGTATVFAAAIGIATGARAGWRPGGRTDKLSTGTALTLWATPTFWLGLVLLVALGVGAGPLPGLFPVAGMRSAVPGAGPPWPALDVAWHLVLPVATLTAVQYAQYHLIMRASLAAQRGAPYLTLARAKGLRDAGVRDRHAVPNALLPTITVLLLNIGVVVSGTVAVEVVFSWPGLGYLAFHALDVPDLPVLHGAFLLLSAGVVTTTMVADAVARRFDPRLRPP
ncbi:MAG TPA: ABC transporter permease [Mycobacteriales bacterium]|nr:ABC transporter permease [Mycobacteriales bacterium]